MCNDRIERSCTIQFCTAPRWGCCRIVGSGRTDYRKSAKINSPVLNEGFLNRRFKRVFAFFCRAAKEGAGSGAAEAAGRQKEKELS